MATNQLKQKVAEAALAYIHKNTVLGVGSGSTVDCFIDALGAVKNNIEAAVAASEASAKRLRANGIEVVDLNTVGQLSVYIDGADEVNGQLQLIKGGGGALTREKIIATVSKQFICMVTEEKRVKTLGQFPLAVEVIPMARSYVARELVKLGGSPDYRQGFVTDNGNVILDVYHLKMDNLIQIEEKINQIEGVVAHGLFAKRHADVLLIGKSNGVEQLNELH